MEALAIILVLFIGLSYAVLCLASIGALLFLVWLAMSGPREYTENNTESSTNNKEENNE